MPEYIECPLEECTHARLPNGEVVVCYGKYVPEPYGSSLRAVINKQEVSSSVAWPCWPALGITPVKERPKPEPVTVEAVVQRWGSAFWMIKFYRSVLTSRNLECGDRVRVTVEKIEEGE